jgi:hypothetical protein
VEPAGYDRDRAQDILEMYRQQRTPPDSSYYFGLDYFGLGLSVDANFQGTDDTTPPIVLLNFIYGVAAYKRWKSPPSVGILNAYFAEHYAEYYKTIPVPPPQGPSGESEGPSDEQDDPNDSDYVPEDTNSTVEAMDELNMVLMYLSGITPEEAAIRREKRLEEEEQMAQEAGRRKVMEWIETNRT